MHLQSYLHYNAACSNSPCNADQTEVSKKINEKTEADQNESVIMTARQCRANNRRCSIDQTEMSKKKLS